MGLKEIFKPSWKNVSLFLFLLAFGYFRWYIGMHPGCCDMPSVASVPPILFPPLIFNEGCVGLGPIGEKTYNIIGWTCATSRCGFCPEGACHAKCDISLISLFYIPIYVYLFSSLIIFLIQKIINLPVIQNVIQKNKKYLIFYLIWSSIGVFLVTIFTTGTFGITFNLWGLMLFVLIPLLILVYFSSRLFKIS